MKCAPTLLLVFWLALLPALAASGQKDFERGTRAFGAQKYQEAAHYFQKAIKAEPQNALFYLWLGITQYRLGDYSASQAALQKAVELEPYGQAGMAARRNLEQLKAVVQQRGERGPQPGASGGQGSAGGRPGPAPGQGQGQSAGSPSSGRFSGQTPTDWAAVGRLDQVEGSDWYVRKTRYCTVYARKGDLAQVNEVVKTLDDSYTVNQKLMGYGLGGPVEMYFFPMSSPLNVQPRWASQIGGYTRAAGVALSGEGRVCLMNLGNPRYASHYDPQEIAYTCRHEMNHTFAFESGSAAVDAQWFLEGLAHTAEETLRPSANRMTPGKMKTYLKGFVSPDRSWDTLIKDRNDQSLEQYRDYDLLLISIIFFLQEKYGHDVVPRLLRARGSSAEEAFSEVTGKSITDLHAEWKGFYGIR